MDQQYRSVYRELRAAVKHAVDYNEIPYYAVNHRMASNTLLFRIFASFLVVGLVMIGSCKVAHAYTKEQAILAVIGEAEGEPQVGKEAIACSIRYRGTLHGVYGLHAPRVRHHLYSQDTYNNAKKAVEFSQNIEYCDALVNGAQYWGSTLVDKQWINKMQHSGYELTATIGNQSFFRKD